MPRIQITDLPTNCELNADDARSVHGGYGVVMKDVLISSYQTGGSSGDVRPSGGSLTRPDTTSNGIIEIPIGL